MKILDCTLRDGGYYTNWDFDRELVRKYLHFVEHAAIDIVEVGYRNLPQKGYYGEYYYLPTETLRFCKSCCPTTALAVMLNAKDVQVEDICLLLEPCKPYVDWVRLAVNPAAILHAGVLAKEIRALGFKVGFNVMYASKWSEYANFEADIKVVESDVDSICIVDSYGSLVPNETESIITTLKTHTHLPWAFHGHNNMEMALANTLVAIENGCGMVDSTIMGMGRGAGNLKTELLLPYLAQQGRISSVALSELVQVVAMFEQLHRKYQWGTNLPYMISGIYSLPQKLIMDWMSKKRYSLFSIVRRLQNLTQGEAQQSFASYDPMNMSLQPILIGGGESVCMHIESIKQYLLQHKDQLFVIFSSARYLHLFDDIRGELHSAICLLGEDARRFEQQGTYLQATDCFVLPPLPHKMDVYLPQQLEDKDVCVLKKYQHAEQDYDSPLQLALELALQTCDATQQIYLIGFDGYANNSELMQENQAIVDAYSHVRTLCSLFPTQYANIMISSLYLLL